MNNISAHGTLNSLSLQSRTAAFAAIVLFAFSGLISGFAVGAFVHPNFALPAHDTGSHPVIQSNPAQTPVANEHPIPLGFPVIDQSSNAEVADGTTIYTLSAQAVDQSIDKGHGKPVHQPGITCRLWLTPTNAGSPNIPPDRLTSPDTLQSSPLPGEVQGLMFDPTTAQTQPCNANGQGIWKYRLDPSVIPGSYYLVVLTDWQGDHYNWSWIIINIKKPG
jgi:hypothetical protein